MSTRRRSSRATNATYILEQQRIDKALKRQAGSVAETELQLAHGVLSEQKCAPVWHAFSRYAARSPRLLQREDARISAAGAGRSQRRRAMQMKIDAGEAGEDAGEGVLADAMAPAAAAAAAEAAKAWDDDGHQVLELLKPLLSRQVTAPMDIQEALMHVVLNAEAHCGSSLAEQAYRTLLQLLEWHPPAKLEDVGLLVNGNLWAPVGCQWQAELHRDKTRVQSLRESGGLISLVGSAHNFVARAAEAACGAMVPLAQGAAEGGDVGEIMLLKYWVKILQTDLDARMAFMRRRGFQKAHRSFLENSLVYRLMQTFTNWADGSNSKPLLIRQLAATVVCAHLAVKHGHGYEGQLPSAAEGAANSPNGRKGRGSNASEQGGSGSGGAGGSAEGAAAQHLVSAAEVGELAATLLGMLYDVYGALDRMRFYVRMGAQGRDNDLVRMDVVMSKAITKELPYKDPENLRVLLAALPPAATVRLLVYTLAHAATRRVEVGVPLSDGLRDVAAHYEDNGVGVPPKILASDALRYLLEEPQTRTISNWNWAAQAMHFNNLPNRAGLPLLVTTLTAAALQQAQRELRLLPGGLGGGGGGAAGGSGGGAADMEVGGEEDEDEGGARAWEAEAAEVAALYRRVAERLQSERSSGGGGGGGSGGSGEAVEGVDCLAVAKRCADRLVRRVETGGLQAGLPLRV